MEIQVRWRNNQIENIKLQVKKLKFSFFCFHKKDLCFNLTLIGVFRIFFFIKWKLLRICMEWRNLIQTKIRVSPKSNQKAVHGQCMRVRISMRCAITLIKRSRGYFCKFLVWNSVVGHGRRRV